MSKPTKLKVNKNRKFSPHHVLLGAARVALDDAKNKKPGHFYSQLTVITFSALSIEAIGNAFGERFVDGWKDYESSSPVAKLRIVCTHLKIDVKFDDSPWSTAKWLIHLRNKIAHAKPQMLDVNFEIRADEYDEEKRAKEPISKLEKEITLKNAIKSYNAVKLILDILCDNISTLDQFGLRSDGWAGSATILP